MNLPRCFGVFGDPIGHSRSPIMHNAAFAALGLPHRYMPFEVSTGRLGEAARGAAALGFGGVNLTTPLKRAASSLCDHLSETAARIGAVNTLRFVRNLESGAVEIHGHNTDSRGFLDALDELPQDPPLRHATILGAGGASLAVADALLGAFPELELTWVSRRPAQVRNLERPGMDGILGIPGAAQRIHACSWKALPAPRGQLLVNTTIVGLAGGPQDFPVDIDLSALEPGARVIDIVYPRPEGGLLDRAAAGGFVGQDGLAMLLWQGVRALELWLDLVLPDPVIEAMRRALYN